MHALAKFVIVAVSYLDIAERKQHMHQGCVRSHLAKYDGHQTASQDQNIHDNGGQISKIVHLIKPYTHLMTAAQDIHAQAVTEILCCIASLSYLQAKVASHDIP